MSENRDRGIRDFSQYDTMATEELEEILRFDADAPEGEDTDVDVILYALEVLVDRRRKNNEITGNTALEAFESFKEHYLPEGIFIEPVLTAKKPRSKPLCWLRGLTAAAAVLACIFLGSVTANAFGFNIWKAVAVWAQETFHLQSDVKVDTEVQGIDRNREYTSLEEAIYDAEEVLGIVPTWIPEGYVLTDIRTDENPLRKKYVAVYENQGTMLKIVVQSYQDGYPEQVERKNGTEETYIAGGNIYYLFEDIDTLQAVWVQDSYECYISGELTVEQMEKMIDSISKG